MSTSVREAKRVVLCDDHEIVREAIKARMANSSSLEIVGEAANGHDVVDVVKELEPDVLIIDVELPKLDGIEATKEVLKVRPRTKVIIFTAHAQPDLLALALRAGASGYVLKSAPAEDIARAVKAVTGGGTFLGGDFAGGKPSEVEKLLLLSPRERQILELLAEGLRVKEIAERLALSPATVHTHVRNAIEKLEVDTRTEAVALAVSFSYLGAGGGLSASSSGSDRRPHSGELQRAAVDAVALPVSARARRRRRGRGGRRSACRRPRCGASRGCCRAAARRARRLAGSVKLGQPVPESNLVSEENSSVPQQTQRYMPSLFSSTYGPVKARSVPALRVTSYCSGRQLLAPLGVGLLVLLASPSSRSFRSMSSLRPGLTICDSGEWDPSKPRVLLAYAVSDRGFAP